MTSLRFTDLQSRPTEFLDVTSVTLDEFQGSRSGVRPGKHRTPVSIRSGRRE
jgi:hypothetical protein